MAQFLLAVVKRRVKKVQGFSLAEVPDRYDSIVPTSMLEASTSATNCLFWSAWIKIGAVANKCFLKAVSASGEQVNRLLVEVRQVAVIPNETPVEIDKS